MVKARDVWQATAVMKQEIVHTQAEKICDQAVVSEIGGEVMSAVQEVNKAGEQS